jgi:hypothetical protein
MDIELLGATSTVVASVVHDRNNWRRIALADYFGYSPGLNRLTERLRELTYGLAGVPVGVRQVLRRYTNAV